MRNFCVVPWVQLATKPIGSCRICCLMSNSKDPRQGILTDDNGKPYNLSTADISEVQNAALAREVRLSMLNDERHPLCETCYLKEDMGASSRRTVSNKMYKDEFTIDEAREATDENGYTTIHQSYWDLRFGNLCNVKCIMCHPASSNQWYSDYVAINGTNKFGDGGLKVALSQDGNRWKDNGEYDWWDRKDVWAKLEAEIPYLKQVYLVGGEPMLIEPHYDLLQKIIDSGRADEVTLEYDTNLTNIHQRAIDLWSSFKKVKLRVSVDDFGEQFNYVRFPSKWSKVSENIEKMSLLNNIELSFTVTWQITTAYTTPNLLKYLDKFDCDTSIRILSTPRYYDVAILPREAKDELIAIYSNLDTKTKVSHLINYLERDGDESLIDECVATLTKLDELRTTNWKTTFPDLYRITK